MRSSRSISPTACCDETRRLSIARRFGSAMISKTDSTLFIYPKEYMLVKVYITLLVGSGHGFFSLYAEGADGPAFAKSYQPNCTGPLVPLTPDSDICDNAANALSNSNRPRRRFQPGT